MTKPRAQPNALHTISRLFLWINSGCNASCQMCSIWQEAPGTMLSADDIKRLSTEWPGLGVRRVILCGEPLLHPDLVEICATVRALGIKLDLLTNGILLERRAKEVVASCDVLQVSLDGPPAVHDITRGKSGAWKRLRAGVNAVQRVAPNLPVDGRCAVHRLNFRYLRATIATAHDLGLRSIGFSATDLHNEEAFRRQGEISDAYVDHLVIRGDDLVSLAAEIALLKDECSADFESGFISDSPADIDRSLVGYYQGLSGLAPMPTPRCNAPWTSAVLEYDGTLRPCFPMPKYGSVFESGGMAATINSAYAKSFRSDLDVESNSTCRACVCQTYITDRITEHWKSNRSAAGWTAAIRS